MYFDAIIRADDLRTAATAAERAEVLGFDGLWTSETAHDPFLPLVPATLATSRIKLGTAVAIAFPRSPTVVAYAAWDLARASNGRFILGLGTQVRAHIERRFSTQWGAPTERLRDYVGAVRAVWHAWQTGERLLYQGQFYNLKLMTPFFSPPPLADPSHVPPIFIAGVNRNLCRLAGEVCDGFHVHPFHTVRYLREALSPWIGEGLEAAGRSRKDIQVSASVFVIAAQGAERNKMREETRRQIAFYASTPSYHTLLALHGWQDAGEELSRLAQRGRWDDMGALISDEMLAEFAVEADTLAEAARTLRERYGDLLDRAAFYLPFEPGEREDDWRVAAISFKG
jgi:probable F420-dependent oxidoreductase